MKTLYISERLSKRAMFAFIIATLVSSLILLPTTESLSATKLLDWEFDDCTTLSGTGGDCGDYGIDNMARAVYHGTIGTTNPSPQGGNYLRPLINSNYPPGGTQPLIWNDNTNFNLTEFYVSWWMMLESDLKDCDGGKAELESIKMLGADPTEINPTDSHININLYPQSWHLYHGGSCAGCPWFPNTHPGWVYDTWIKYEIYIKWGSGSTGILKIWRTAEGGSRELEVDSQDIDWELDSSSQYIDIIGVVYHAKTFGSACGNVYGHMRIDDVELWDGMPDVIHPPKNLHIYP